MKIGVFDSGFGGLSILKHIIARLPNYSYVYLGDNARAPYGDRSEELIYEFTRQGVEFLFQNDCAIVLLACNTASTQALRRLQQEWLPLHHPDKRILGVIIPVVETLAKLKKNSIVGIMGTRATINSNVYVLECEKRISNNLVLIQKACPLLVPLIEEGWDKTIVARKIIKKYLRPLKTLRLDVLVLACTHYALMIKMIRSSMGKKTRVLEEGPIVALSLQAYLSRHTEIERTLDTKPNLICYTTDPQKRAHELVVRFWKGPLVREHAKIEGL